MANITCSFNCHFFLLVRECFTQSLEYETIGSHKGSKISVFMQCFMLKDVMSCKLNGFIITKTGDERFRLKVLFEK